MSRVTSKGQVTIPKKIRDAFGLLPGTEVEFVSDDKEFAFAGRLVGGDGEEVVKHLRESGKSFTMTTEEIMRLTRGEDWGTGRLEEGDGDSS